MFVPRTSDGYLKRQKGQMYLTTFKRREDGEAARKEAQAFLVAEAQKGATWTLAAAQKALSAVTEAARIVAKQRSGR